MVCMVVCVCGEGTLFLYDLCLRTTVKTLASWHNRYCGPRVLPVEYHSYSPVELYGFVVTRVKEDRYTFERVLYFFLSNNNECV